METKTWALDPTHSEIQFKVKHLLISTVTGQFNRFNATVETGSDDFADSKIHFTADVDSISTNNEQRDAHLKNGDFFDAENHPQVIFEGDRMEKTGDENYKLHGTLTMRGTSRKETLDVDFGGVTKDPWGNQRAGFSITGKINRNHYGVSFGMVSETGGVLLGEEVKIIANVQLVKQALMQAA